MFTGLVVFVASASLALADTSYGNWKSFNAGSTGATVRARNYVVSDTSAHTFRAYTIVTRLPYTSATVPAYGAGANAELRDYYGTLMAATTWSYNVGPIPGGTSTVVLSFTAAAYTSQATAAHSDGEARGAKSSGSGYTTYVLDRSGNVANY
ncbi:hypothetical protein [Demequina sp.]|uniref:hypothetical protein n=1 Tax=Demequina sp. TaxID=2050685 RepID=UPI003D146338